MGVRLWLLVFEALGDLQRGRQGEKDHLTIIELCLQSGNASKVLSPWKADLDPAVERKAFREKLSLVE